MARNTFTEGRLKTFERMMQAVPGHARKYEYEPKKQQSRKEKLKQRQYHSK